MNRDTEETTFDKDGNSVTLAKYFIADRGFGEVEMEFIFAADGLDGKELVVFENLYQQDTNTLVADHADINDAEQTVSVTWQHHPKIGGGTMIVTALVIGILAFVVTCILFFGKRRMEKK